MGRFCFTSIYARFEDRTLAKEIIPNDKYVRWTGAVLSLSNAKDLLAASYESSSAGRNGLAVALAVLSAEESAKSLGLITHALEAKVEPENLDKYFKSHKHKHGAGVAFALGVRAFKAMQHMVAEIQADESIPESEKGNELMRRLMSYVELALERSESPPMLADLGDWRESADSAKQKGLYVSYFDGEWNAPSMMTDTDSRTYQEKAAELIDIVIPMVELGFDTVQSVFMDVGKISGAGGMG